MSVQIALIFAMARNRAIGHHGEIPWYIPDDFKRFKALTSGHVCMMGRKTFEGIVARLGKPLPGRISVVVGHLDYMHNDVKICDTVPAGIEVAKKIATENGQDQIFICGGSQIYAATFAMADRLYVTEVDLAPDADVFMPAWDMSQFREVSRQAHPGTPGFCFIDYERI